ncbi:KCNB2, partial [Symbiodinium necroappetens]
MPQHHPTPGELQPTPDHELITCHTTYKKAPKWSFPGRLSGVKPSGTEVGHYSSDDPHRDINGRYKRDQHAALHRSILGLRIQFQGGGAKPCGVLQRRRITGHVLQLQLQQYWLRWLVRNSRKTSKDEDKTESASAEDAARVIQSCWRKAAGSTRKPDDGPSPKASRDSDRPFYTHTLGLTYVSSTQRRMEEEGKTTAEKIFVTLSDPGSSSAAQIVSIVIVAFTVASICGFVLETDRLFYEMNPELWPLVEVICTVVFTVEYLTLALTCRFAGVPVVSFILAPSSVADLVALLPFYVEVVLRNAGFTNTAVLKSFKVVRLIRVLRVFKLGRYAAGLQIMWKAVVDSRQAISVLFFLLGIGVVMFSSTIFYLERLSCPLRDEFNATELTVYLAECNDTYNRGVSPSHGLCCSEDNSPLDFPSIVNACWWAVVTLTSLGYGDLYPKTVQGKCVGMMAMIAGLLLIALPIAIISQKFQDIYEANDKEDAKNRAAQRMKGAPHETWTLIPGSDVVRRLKALPVK